jgi:DNA-binding transcriptional LysR family regulator
VNLIASMRYLVALNEHRHFGRAAEACHITQPALSNAMRALEESLKVAIIKRGRTYLGLTLEGERVLLTAQRMLFEQEMLEQDLFSTVDNPQGHLHIGAVPMAIPVATSFAAMLHASHPNIVPIVRSMTSHEIETRLGALTLDIGLGYAERVGMQDVKCTLIPQYTENYYLLRRRTPVNGHLRDADWPHLGADMTWQEAATLPLCVLTPDMHNRAIIDHAFAEAGCKIKPAMETDAIVTLLLSAQLGQVCGILPAALIRLVSHRDDLEACLLVNPSRGVPVGFLTLEGGRPSRALQAALSFAETADWTEALKKQIQPYTGQ